MSVDQIAVYQAFLTTYNNGSKSSHLNLANRTFALELPDTKINGACLQGIVLDDLSTSAHAIHQLDSKTQWPTNITLVDPHKQNRAIQQNDPHNTMRQGKCVNDAVEGAFAAGLLTLSEVAFDKTHQYSVMNFSFVCGGLCGHGGTGVFQKQDGRWKRLNRQCGGWIS